MVVMLELTLARKLNPEPTFKNNQSQNSAQAEKAMFGHSVKFCIYDFKILSHIKFMIFPGKSHC